MMYRLSLIIFGLILSVSSIAQTEGFYRVQNYKTNRFLYVRDCTGSLNSKDFDAIELWAGQDDANCDPGSVMYLVKDTSTSDSEQSWNITSQNTGIKQITGISINIYSISSSSPMYQVRSSGNYLYDIGEDEYHPGMGRVGIGTSEEMPGKSAYRNWYVLPISNTSSNFFAFKPTVTAKGKYYAPFFAAFAYTPSSNNIKTWYVTKVDKDNAIAVVKQITGTVAKSQPVIIECAGQAISSNKADPTTQTGIKATGNLLKGVYFSNGDRSGLTHKSTPAAVEYNATTMRVLGTDKDGDLAFVTESENLVTDYFFKDDDWITTKLLPHNQSYLTVESDCPSTLKVMDEDSYKKMTAITQVTQDEQSSDIFTLSGIKTSNVLKGHCYIMNGKKFISK